MVAIPPAATEATLEDVLAALTTPLLNAFQEEMLRLFPPRALQYARDTSDQMRMTITSGNISTLLAIALGNNNSQATWHSTGAPNSMEQRESEKTQSQFAFRNQRSRWTLV